MRLSLLAAVLGVAPARGGHVGLRAIVAERAKPHAALMFGPGDDAGAPPANPVANYSVAILDEATGNVSTVLPPVRFADDATMPGCNAAAAAGVYYKTSPEKFTMKPANASAFHNCAGCAGKRPGHCCRDPTDPGMSPTCFTKACADLPAAKGETVFSLALDAATGALVRNVTFSTPMFAPPFAAWDAARRVAWSVVPYTYTALGLFKVDFARATATKVRDFNKTSTDGVGVCAGRVLAAGGRSLLAYQFGGQPDALRFVDLETYAVAHEVAGFFAAFVVDPLNPHALLAIRNAHRDKGVELVAVDPVANATTTVLAIASTPAGRMLRAQDQADFAVRPDGLRAWFVASYNVADGRLVRGLFALDVAADRSGAAVVSTIEAFDDDDGKPWIGTIDYFA